MDARPDPDPDLLGPACSKCGESKRRVGRRWRCRPCEAAYQKQYMSGWLEKNREKNRVSSLAWAAAHRAEAAERARIWREENLRRAKDAQRDKYLANRDDERVKRRAHYLSDPQQYKRRAADRRAVQYAAFCEHGRSCVSVAFLNDLYAKPCFYCDGRTTDADHFRPLASGGLHCQENLVPACESCNSSKHARDPIEFIVGARGDQ